MSETLAEPVLHPLAQFCVVSGEALFFEKPRIEAVSLTMGLIFTGKPACHQKIPPTFAAVVPKICAVSHPSPETTNETSVQAIREAISELQPFLS